MKEFERLCITHLSELDYLQHLLNSTALHWRPEISSAIVQDGHSYFIDFYKSTYFNGIETIAKVHLFKDFLYIQVVKLGPKRNHAIEYTKSFENKETIIECEKDIIDCIHEVLNIGEIFDF